ncbi:hypothetical protein SAMN00777080_4974 [Aquiflexum balticum DSM 16537]|uniref:SGNH/GDSL hydrolase family protein n=1 Tax=Aquiflexum balticum DSM 16537 TaxID=758820 RepID=A0A1W2HC59_9BACT|nr:hypothetical protein [Aquiflexum balticum]SMD46292.1 hypothetical protein SAMN00777080_4974 [Aquiflexum balticum DSM 16537]
MKRLFIKLLILSVFLFGLDWGGGLILRRILNNSPDGRYYKAIYTLDSSTEDLLIFGSSRAEANYVPDEFRESLGFSTWNAGRGGQFLPFWYSLYLGMGKRHIPKVVIINVENDFLKAKDRSSAFERAGFLRPFYKTHLPIQPILDKISKSEHIMIKSDLYAFNSSFYYLLRPFVFQGVDGKREDMGWKPLSGTMALQKGKPKIVKESDSELSPLFVELFEKFVSDLNSNGTKVFICISPDFGRIVQETSTLNYLKSMKGINLIDFSSNTEFITNYKLYKDRDHLNIQGARLFSQALAKEIAENL